MVFLNALRRPVLWKRVESVKLQRTLEGSAIELLNQIVTDLGLALELPEDFQREEKLSLLRYARFSKGTPILTVIQWAIAAALGERCCSFQLVLESDHVLLLREHQAQRFWKKWMYRWTAD
jgi:hypothetical protein